LLISNRSLVLNISYLIIFCILSGQQLFSQQLNEKIEEFNNENLKEELYLSTDRDIYVTGEQVWLKVFKMNGLTHTPGNISKVVYVELLDKNNFPLKQLKIKSDDASGSSGFILPDNISSGNYLIRAYTSWMQNWSVNQFFHKTISVINPFEDISHINLPSDRKIADTLLFFPEGGTLVAGIKSRIGIRSLDKSGIAAPMQGVVSDSRGDTVSFVQTGTNGSGTVTVVPVAGNKMFLSFKGSDGSNKKISLPGISNSGITLSVSESDDKSAYKAKIEKSRDLFTSNQKFNFLILSGGIISYIKEINLQSDSIITISRDEFPDGLSQFFVIDENGIKIAERSVYKENNEHIKYTVTLEKPEYSIREKVKLTISASDMAGNPVETDLSVSVAKQAVAAPSGITYLKRSSLTSIPGNNINEYSVNQINDYLISYKNKDFNWKNILNSPDARHNYLPELEGHLIKGFVRLKTTGEPMKNIDISISWVGKTARCQFGKTDEKGEFNFVIKEAGLSEIVIQPLSQEITGYYIELKQPFSDTFTKYQPEEFIPDSSKIGELNNAVISMQINNIYEPFRQKMVSIPISEIPDFYGKAEKMVQMGEYIELTSVREAIKEIIPSVYTFKQDGKYGIKLLNKFTRPFENKPLVLVDGVPVYDFDKVLNINSREIEMVEITNLRYFYSNYIFDGVLSFITKKGNLSAIDSDNLTFRQVYEACQIQRNFYSPDYSTDSLKNSHIPDFRNTLYWGADLHTMKDGRTEIEFYTSDESADFTINIEGITSDGKTGEASVPLIIKQK
jgi:hypothetical protein